MKAKLSDKDIEAIINETVLRNERLDREAMADKAEESEPDITDEEALELSKILLACGRVRTVGSGGNYISMEFWVKNPYPESEQAIGVETKRALRYLLKWFNQ